MHMYTAFVNRKEVSGYAERFVVSFSPEDRHTLVKCFHNVTDKEPSAVFKMGTSTEKNCATEFHCEKFDLHA